MVENTGFLLFKLNVKGILNIFDFLWLESVHMNSNNFDIMAKAFSTKPEIGLSVARLSSVGIMSQFHHDLSS
jgi:hypothetical protein